VELVAMRWWPHPMHNHLDGKVGADANYEVKVDDHLEEQITQHELTSELIVLTNSHGRTFDVS
jgi:hypothetical protein